MEHTVNSAGVAEDRGVTSVEEMLQLVTFKLGSEEFALDILLVQEINRRVEITKVPKTPEFVEGVINLRGKIVPVLDLRKRFGLVGREFTAQSRIIVVNIDKRVLGLMVDSVSEVLRIPRHTVEPPPPIVAGIDATYIKGIGKFEGRLLILLDLGKVLSGTKTEDPATEN
jgi:purine-binding chemotaxis protein CheW